VLTISLWLFVGGISFLAMATTTIFLSFFLACEQHDHLVQTP
jgi:hypothetical protein